MPMLLERRRRRLIDLGESLVIPNSCRLLTERRYSDDAAMQRGRQIVDILRDTQAAIPDLIASSSLSTFLGESDSLSKVRDR